MAKVKPDQTAKADDLPATDPGTGSQPGKEGASKQQGLRGHQDVSIIREKGERNQDFEAQKPGSGCPRDDREDALTHESRDKEERKKKRKYLRRWRPINSLTMADQGEKNTWASGIGCQDCPFKSKKGVPS